MSESQELFLGFDLSTQGLKCTALRRNLNTAAEFALNFDSDLPHYKTTGGAHVHNHPDGGIRATSPTLMFVEALDMLLSRMSAENFPFKYVVAISGSGQQHGSVYWRQGAEAVLQDGLDPSQPLVTQLRDTEIFSFPDSPIWMDSSTTKYCRKMEEYAGSPLSLAELTGSRGYERYTASQIARLAEEEPSRYNATERVSLISSFMASLFIGSYAPEDVADGSGMNLMHLTSLEGWIPSLVSKTASNLQEKLCPAPVTSNTVVGSVSPYFARRYGFSSDRPASVIAWSGDNPNSAAGMGLGETDIVVSLGTSDTAFGIASVANPGLVAHVYRSPLAPLQYLPLVCYSNGSLTREEVKGNLSWDEFEAMVSKRPAGNDGIIGFFYNRPEIVPRVNASEGPILYRPGMDTPTDGPHDKATLCRAVIEARALAIASHTSKIGIQMPPRRILVTGGASRSKALCQSLADTLGAPVVWAGDAAPNSASRGAAIRAVHGTRCVQENRFVPFREVVEGGEMAAMGTIAEPNLADSTRMRSDMLARYNELEVLVEKQLGV